MASGSLKSASRRDRTSSCGGRRSFYLGLMVVLPLAALVCRGGPAGRLGVRRGGARPVRLARAEADVRDRGRSWSSSTP